VQCRCISDYILVTIIVVLHPVGWLINPCAVLQDKTKRQAGVGDIKCLVSQKHISAKRQVRKTVCAAVQGILGKICWDLEWWYEWRIQVDA
jgi:hypothetical protein